MAETARLLPDLDDPVTAPFWKAARAHELRFQKCARCSYVRWPPSPVCPNCLEPGGEWTQMSGTGTIWSFGIYDHVYDPSLRGAIPYNVTLVELDEGPRLITNLVGVELDAIRIGMRVTPVFEAVSDAVTLVKFRPLADGQ